MLLISYERSHLQPGSQDKSVVLAFWLRCLRKQSGRLTSASLWHTAKFASWSPTDVIVATTRCTAGEFLAITLLWLLCSSLPASTDISVLTCCQRPLLLLIICCRAWCQACRRSFHCWTTGCLQVRQATSLNLEQSKSLPLYPPSKMSLRDSQKKYSQPSVPQMLCNLGLYISWLASRMFIQRSCSVGFTNLLTSLLCHFKILKWREQQVRIVYIRTARLKLNLRW